jgi:hypothetical protein
MKKLLLANLITLIFSDCFAVLAPFVNLTKQGLNYAYSSICLQQRFAAFAGPAQPAAMNISGIPAGATIEAAYLYWVMETNVVGAGNIVTLRNPDGVVMNFPGAVIGTVNGGKCWGRAFTVNRRANVTALITGTLNGNYRVSGLPIGANEVDGAALVIIYSDCKALWKGTLRINDGIDVYNQNSPTFNSTQTVGGFAAPAGVFGSSAFCLVTDYQNLGAVRLFINGGEIVPFVQNFWNWEKNPAANPITAGQTSVTFSTVNVNPAISDCYDWVLAGVYYRFCSAPPDFNLGYTTLCVGNPTSLFGTICSQPVPASYTFNWTGTGGFSSSLPTPAYTYPAAGSYTASLTITDSEGCSASAGPLTIDVPPCIVPVTLLNFNAEATEKGGRLSWEMASGQEMTKYVVERSSDNTRFYGISEPLSGSSGFRDVFSWLDPAPIKGVNYYRIRITAPDGETGYSVIRTASFAKEIIPAPVTVKYSSDTRISLRVVPDRSSPLEYSLHDLTGSVVLSGRLNPETSEQEIETSSIAKGLYLLSIYSAGSRKTLLQQKILKN